MNNRRTRSEKTIDELLLQFNSDYLQYSNHLNGYTKISKDEMKKKLVIKKNNSQPSVQGYRFNNGSTIDFNFNNGDKILFSLYENQDNYFLGTIKKSAQEYFTINLDDLKKFNTNTEGMEGFFTEDYVKHGKFIDKAKNNNKKFKTGIITKSNKKIKIDEIYQIYAYFTKNQNGGSSTNNERHFRVVQLEGKKVEIGGVSISGKASPGNAARKLLTSIAHHKGLKKNKKASMGKVKFCIQEYTQGSSKKVYGPYVGHYHKYTGEELKKAMTADGKVKFTMKPVVKLAKGKNNMKGGFDINIETQTKIKNQINQATHANPGKGIKFNIHKVAIFNQDGNNYQLRIIADNVNTIYNKKYKFAGAVNTIDKNYIENNIENYKELQNFDILVHDNGKVSPLNKWKILRLIQNNSSRSSH
jgi:hypothetical protein